MGLFSKKPQYTQQEVDEITRYRPEQNTRIEYSLGTSDLDELLQYHAPKHEAALKDLQETQKQILENQGSSPVSVGENLVSTVSQAA